jgi:putative transcriptional regulator
VPGFQPVAGTVGVLDLDADADGLLGRAAGARVFAGYAGWSPGQLEEELAEDAWIVVDATPGDAVTADPERLWADVLARQPGRVAWLARFPDDPSMN